MVPNVGILEIAIVLVIALIVFGPKRLPDLGKSLGKGIREFREGVSSIGSDHDELDDHELRSDPVTEPIPAEPAELDSGPVEVEVEEITAEPEASDTASSN
jgi:sec-independent protein translocase protein TatA